MFSINLLGSAGFQKDTPRHEAHIQAKPKEGTKKKGATKKLKSRFVDEFLAILVAVGVAVLVWWLFSLTSFIRSDVKEQTPGEFLQRTGPESTMDLSAAWLE